MGNNIETLMPPETICRHKRITSERFRNRQQQTDKGMRSQAQEKEEPNR